MCDCWCGCTNPGLQSLDGTCTSCDRGYHATPKKKSKPAKKAVINTNPICGDCFTKSIIITARYKPYKGKRVYYCTECRVVLWEVPK